MKIGIVLVNYNDRKDTVDCLKSLSEIEKKDLELKTYLIDNNSSQKLNIDEADYKSLHLEIINSHINLGFSGGNNLGIQKALSTGCEFVLILNNDTTQKANFLEELLRAFDDISVGIAVPKIYFSEGREFHRDRYKKNELGKVIWYAGGSLNMKNIIASHRGVDEVDHGQFDKEENTQFASGCCMLVRKEVFKKIGFFDDKYFLYLEDLDFSLRAERSGFDIKFIPKSIIWHKNAGSTGGSGSKLQDYFISRNRLIFGNKYASPKARFALFRESVRFLLSGRPMQKLGVKDYYLNRFGKGSIDL